MPRIIENLGQDPRTLEHRFVVGVRAEEAALQTVHGEMPIETAALMKPLEHLHGQSKKKRRQFLRRHNAWKRFKRKNR